MSPFQNQHTKNSLIIFLKYAKVNDSVLSKLMELPEAVIYLGNEYKLNIVVTWYESETTYYNFEINYYDEINCSFLFTYHIFSDVKKSIITTLIELKELKLI